MKLVLQTRILIRAIDNSLVEWDRRSYVIKIEPDEFIDIVNLESLAHRAACKIEKHELNYHEEFRDWYVLPDSINPEGDFKVIEC